jgi:hypothetical protein
MRVVKVAAILLIGPSLAILIAFFLSALVLPADPNFEINGSHAAPGDGFLVMGFIFISLIISIPASAMLAGSILRGKSENQATGQTTKNPTT